jgi:predicted Zn-dependent protease
MSDDTTTAETLIESGRYEQAIALLEVVLAAAPDDPVALYHLGSAHDSAGHEGQAVGPYRRALAHGLDPQLAVAARIQLASTLRNLGETSEAVEILEAVVNEHPEHRAARMFLALALVSDGRAIEAVHLLLDLLLTDPGPPERYARSLRNYTDDLARPA